MPRRARKQSETGIYHVMMRGNERKQIFFDTDDYYSFIRIVNRCKDSNSFQLLAYCLMPNHVHLLIKEEEKKIDIVMRDITTRYVYWYNEKYCRVGHLFQDRFKSEPIETDDYLITVLRYIHQNPLKAGICKNVGDYKYSSYNDYFCDNPLVDKEIVKGLLSPDEFRELNNTLAEQECLDIESKQRQQKRLTDDAVLDLIKNNTKFENLTDFQKANKEERRKMFRILYDKGASIRQIASICNVGKNTVEFWLKQDN